MSDTYLKPEDQMMQWITSKWITKPIYVAAELGIADLLRDAPLSVDALAEKTNTHPPSLYRLLRALSSIGIFAETDERIFGMTPLAQCLLSDAIRPMARMFLSDWHDKAWNSLAYIIRTGRPGFDHAFGKKSFEWMEENPEARAILDQGQGLKAMGFAQAVIDACDFSEFSSICDVGGGQGSFLIQLLASYPHIKGIVADMPGAVVPAEKAIAKADLNDRCKAIPHDFLEETPPICDAYFLVNVLHDWEDNVCCRILKKFSQVMNAETRLWIVEYLLEPGPGFSIAKLLDIEVLVMGGGRERTIDEYKTLLGSVELAVLRAVPTNRGPALLECTIK
ncbi:MAG: methyltransferase [Deltaproteobacteria bacterium]|nr:methyltransferase [Deltaproteobacteria bacterium]